MFFLNMIARYCDRTLHKMDVKGIVTWLCKNTYQYWKYLHQYVEILNLWRFQSVRMQRTSYLHMYVYLYRITVMTEANRKACQWVAAHWQPPIELSMHLEKCLCFLVPTKSPYTIIYMTPFRVIALFRVCRI